MIARRHLGRIGMLMVTAALLLIWLARHTDVMFADGLRYIDQAQALDRGSWKEGVARSVDHPLYPFAIAAAHRTTGGTGPADWQAAGQAASVLAGVLLVIPIYWLAHECQGATAAWLSCVLFYLVPLTGHVLADVLSEGHFLLFWTAGCAAASRFLRDGRVWWLVVAAGLACASYLVRPEGVLLPAALLAAMAVASLRPALRMSRASIAAAAIILLVGPMLAIGPYVALKGGIGTKPAVARLLGLAARSGAMAVERERPLSPEQSTAGAYKLAVRAVVRAVTGAVPAPVLLLAAVGLLTRPDDSGARRQRLFLGLVAAAWLLALVRLYVTGGYCSPRHAMILSVPAMLAAAVGIEHLSNRLAHLDFPLRGWAALGPLSRRTAIVASVFLTLLALDGRGLLAPINAGYGGYRQAGEWLSAHTTGGTRVFDLKGWALYYGDRPGYSFEELDRAANDPGLRWVVAHDALLLGPWYYCDILRRTVGNRQPVKTFPDLPAPGAARVHIFDLTTPAAMSAAAPPRRERR